MYSKQSIFESIVKKKKFQARKQKRRRKRIEINLKAYKTPFRGERKRETIGFVDINSIKLNL